MARPAVVRTRKVIAPIVISQGKIKNSADLVPDMAAALVVGCVCGMDGRS